MKPSRYKKILVVAESIDVEDSSGSKANVALIQNLHKAGFEILVYHYTRKHVSIPGIPCIAIKEQKWNLKFLLSRIQRKLQHGLNINLAKHLEPRWGFSFTFLNDSYSIAQSLRKLEDFYPEIVLTLSKGASFRPHHALLKIPELHSKWMAYIHDPYPFHFYPEPYQWSEPGYKQKIGFFKEVSKKCRWAAFPSLLLKDWMESHFGDFGRKSIIIPHQLFDVDLPPLPFPSYFDSNKFSLLHAGNLMKQRSPLALISGFKKFLTNNPDAVSNSQLLLLGSASYHEQRLKELEEEIEQLYISDGNVSFGLVLQLQKEASVNIILESKANISPFLPGKFPHCVAANKPILHIGPKKSEAGRLLGPEYAFKAEADNSDKIAQLIEYLYRQWLSNPEELKLNRDDLIHYLSHNHLKEVFSKIPE